MLYPTPVVDSNGKTTGYGYTDSDNIDELKSLGVKIYKSDTHYQTVSVYFNADGSTTTMDLNATLTSLMSGGYDFNSIMDETNIYQWYLDNIANNFDINNFINNNVNVFDIATFDFNNILNDFDYNTIFNYINMTTVYNGLNFAADAALQNNRLILDYKVPDGELDSCYYQFVLIEEDGTTDVPVYETGTS